MDNQTLQVFFFLFGAIFLLLLVLGATNKVVVYFDGADFALSMVPLLSLVSAVILMGVFGPEVEQKDLTGQQIFILGLGIVISIGTAVWSVRMSVFYNKNLPFGVLVGIFKVAAATLGLLIIVGLVSRAFDSKMRLRDALWAIVLLSFFIWIGKKLINGYAVYQEKGWPLPAPRGA